MECEKCGDIIEDGDEREFHGRTLCEDCYMDTLSPARTMEGRRDGGKEYTMGHGGTE